MHLQGNKFKLGFLQLKVDTRKCNVSPRLSAFFKLPCLLTWAASKAYCLLCFDLCFLICVHIIFYSSVMHTPVSPIAHWLHTKTFVWKEEWVEVMKKKMIKFSWLAGATRLWQHLSFSLSIYNRYISPPVGLERSCLFRLREQKCCNFTDELLFPADWWAFRPLLQTLWCYQ